MSGQGRYPSSASDLRARQLSKASKHNDAMKTKETSTNSNRSKKGMDIAGG